jgi:hypothetical protein
VAVAFRGSDVVVAGAFGSPTLDFGVTPALNAKGLFDAFVVELGR